MVVQSLVAEVANTGEFVGQAIAVPVTNLLTLLAFAAYLFYLNPLMAVISMALYPVAIVVIPFLQNGPTPPTRSGWTRAASSRP